MAKLAISKIRVRNRYRKFLGDTESLASSIKELGLLQYENGHLHISR